MRIHSAHTRDGFALPVALLAMMVIGAIVTGGFYASSQASRISNSTDLGSQAFYVAEYGLEEKLGTWKNAVLDTIEKSHTFDTVTVSSGGQELGTYVVTVRRIGLQVFLMTSEGRVQAGPSNTSVRRIGTIVRTVSPSLPALSALSIYGGLTAGGSSEIRGNDSGGPGCVQTDTVSGVTAYDSTLVAEGNKERITGKPPVDQDASLDTAALSDFGAMDLDDLRAAATKIYSAGESENGMTPTTTVNADGVNLCDTSVRSNWGDPSGVGPCANEFPIIWAQGDLHLKTGQGQGILIVDGDLTASGNFDFYGIVIVLGELYTTGTGNHLEGNVIVQGHGQLDSESTTLGNSLVQYSKCRIDKAFNAAVRPRPLGKRSWIDFSAATKAAGLVAAPST